MENKRNEQELTERLYETDGFVSEFSATVIECSKISNEKYNRDDIYALVLSETAFFPEGGGQGCDVGMIDDKEVIDVQLDEEGRINHFVVAEDDFSIGCNVTGKVDMTVRFPRMQNHSAEHIISGLVNSKFGYENVGFHMSEKTVRFDFNGPLSKEDMALIEKEANEYVYKNVAIKIYFPSADELKNIEYRSKLDILEGVRLVEFEGADMCACCAPHVSYTGQIGIIKIIDVMPHRQGTRVTMVAGTNAVIDYNMLHNDNQKIMALLSSKRETTAEFACDLLERNNKLKEENTNLKKEISGFVINSVLEGIRKRSADDKSVEVVFSNALDNVGMRNLINAALDEFDGAVAGFIGNDNDGYRYVIGSNSKDYDIVAISKMINKELGGKGGGNAQMVQGSVNAGKIEIEKLLKTV